MSNNPLLPSKPHRRVRRRYKWGKKMGDIWEKAVWKMLEKLGFKVDYSDIHGADLKAWRGKYTIYVECKIRNHPTSFLVYRDYIEDLKDKGIFAFLYCGRPFFVSFKKLLDYLNKTGKWITFEVDERVKEILKQQGFPEPVEYEYAHVTYRDLLRIASSDLKSVIEEVINRKLDWVE